MQGQVELSDGYLWRAVRSLEEQAELHRRLGSVKRQGREQSTAMRRHAEEIERRSHVLRRILVERGDTSVNSQVPRKRRAVHSAQRRKSANTLE